MYPTVFSDRFFDTFFADPFRPARRGPAYRPEHRGMMRTDIREEEGRYLLDIDLPGFKKEEVTAELKDGRLIVSAAKDEQTEEKNDAGYLHRERLVSRCRRAFVVGDAVSEGDITAKLEDGILHLTIPKKEKALPEARLVAIE